MSLETAYALMDLAFGFCFCILPPIVVLLLAPKRLANSLPLRVISACFLAGLLAPLITGILFWGRKPVFLVVLLVFGGLIPLLTRALNRGFETRSLLFRVFVATILSWFTAFVLSPIEQSITQALHPRDPRYDGCGENVAILLLGWLPGLLAASATAFVLFLDARIRRFLVNRANRINPNLPDNNNRGPISE